MAPDETIRAVTDMYARTSVGLIPGPIDPKSLEKLQEKMAIEPQALVLAQLPGKALTPRVHRIANQLGLNLGESEASVDRPPEWATASQLRIAHLYALPNGRRYVLLETAR
jgi:hypothetical protein